MKLAVGAAVLAILMLAGCGTQDATSAQLPSSSQAPAPVADPVSTTAALSGQCAMGYEWDTGDSATGAFTAGAFPGGTGAEDPVIAYSVTLTSVSEATADVGGFAVAFYDSAGSEVGSDRETASGFITAGQSLSWNVIEDHSVNGWGDDPEQQFMQTSAIPADAASCQFVQWYTSS